MVTRQLPSQRAMVAMLAVALSLLVAPQSAQAAGTHSETAGGTAHTWTDPSSAGGVEGPSIASGQTVQIACVTQAFRVQDGNTNWYRIAEAPWSNQYWVSADAFYNNGATSGSLRGTPFVDPSVPDCSSLPTGRTETTGGAANTWSNPANAGGAHGPTIGAYQTVTISCRLTGFRVADGNTWWYRVNSSPWDDNYYVSADAFYNNGATSGSLRGTPFVDPAVPECDGVEGNTEGSKSNPAVVLTQGPAAPTGFRYAVSITGFDPDSPVTIRCFDSVSTAGFYTFSIRTNAVGAASTASYCYSGDGPDHWVTAGDVTSNHVAWADTAAGNGYGGGPAAPSLPTPKVARPSSRIAIPAPATPNPPRPRQPRTTLPPTDYYTTSTACAGFASVGFFLSAQMCSHYLDRTGTSFRIDMPNLVWTERPLWASIENQLRRQVSSKYQSLRAQDPAGSFAVQFDSGWNGYRATAGDWRWSIGGFQYRIFGDLWIGPQDSSGNRPVQLRYRSAMFDVYNFEKDTTFYNVASRGWAAEYWVNGDTRMRAFTSTSRTFSPGALPFEW